MRGARSASMGYMVNHDIKAKKLTENGYTEEFEAEILAAAGEAYAAVASGKAKLYKNSAELFADIDADDDENE